MLREIIERHGVPLSLYSDSHGIFQRSPKEPESLAEQLRGKRDPTQFARALKELDIGHVPTGKGAHRAGLGHLPGAARPRTPARRGIHH